MSNKAQRWLAVGCLMLAPWLSRAQQPSEHINAYVFGLRAEQAEAAGKLAEALDLYAESLRLYQETARLHPEWNPSVVQYRMNFTGNQMERLKQLLAAEVDKKKAEEVAAKRAELDALVAEAAKVWSEKNKALETRIGEVEAERDQVRQSVVALEKELETLRNRSVELDQSIADREARLATLEAARTETAKTITSLEGVIAEKDKALADVQAQLAKKIKPLITAEELTALRADLEKRTAEVSVLQDRVSELQDRTDTLSTQLMNERAEISAVLSQRDEATASAEALTRQIKEQKREIGRLAKLASAADERDKLKEEREAQAREADALREQLSKLSQERDVRARDIAGLESRIAGLQQEADAASERQRQTEAELAEARRALELSRGTSVNNEDYQQLLARFEKTEVENILFRDTMADASNRMMQANAQAANAADRLALEQKKWDAERVLMLERINAMSETVDLNKAELEKISGLRAMNKALEKENRKLSRRVSFADDQPEDDVELLQQRIDELEVEIQHLRNPVTP